MTACQKRIGFIGLGIMGQGMARRLIKAGHQLFVFSRTRTKCQDIVDEGAIWCDSAGEAAKNSEIVITVVGLPSDVEQVYLGESGILSAARPGTLLIDMSTSRPDLAIRIHGLAGKRGLRALDAPVSGGDVGAREGTLAIMVGGDRTDFETAMPVLTCMGKTIAYLGLSGSGQHGKMANQIAISGAILGVTEALTYTLRVGLDPEEVLSVIGGGAASSHALHTFWPKMARGDFAPGFFIEHFIKDMGIAEGESQQMGLELEGLALVKSLYERLREQGWSQNGIQALFKRYNS